MSSFFLKTRPRPVWTLVAVMNSSTGVLADAIEIDELLEDLRERVLAAAD